MASQASPIVGSPIRAGDHCQRTWRSSWWLPLALLAAVLWRLPMWLHCTEPLDSDAAVNGLTLKGMLEGQWRWHLPGIHYMGVTEVLLSVPAAAVFGANPYTLIFGPVLAYLLFMLAIYALARQLYGPVAGTWSLVATVFVSPDVLFWSTFPIGGHILITFWHVVTLLLLMAYLRSGKRGWLIGLGVWAGLGLYTYHMYLYTIALVLPALVLARVGAARRRTSLLGWAGLVLGFLLGWLPHWLGQHEPDVYGSQVPSPRMAVLALPHNSAVLVIKCLPKFATGWFFHRGAEGQEGELSQLWLTTRAVAVAVVALLWVVAAFVFYRGYWQGVWRRWAGRGGSRSLFPEENSRAVVESIMAATPPLVLLGFLFHPAVVNEHNSRYLIYLMAWWPVAWAKMAGQWWNDRRWLAVVATVALILGYSVLGIVDFQRRGWMTSSGRLLPPRTEPLVEYLKSQDEFRYFYAWYWDAYRFTFLTGERVRGVPVHPRFRSDWKNPPYDHVRIPKYAKEAADSPLVGLIFRQERWPKTRGAPPRSRLVYQTSRYSVFVHRQVPIGAE